MKQPSSANNRRNFLKTSGAIAAGLLTPGLASAGTTSGTLPALPVNPRTVHAMTPRNLGKTGY